MKNVTITILVVVLFAGVVNAGWVTMTDNFDPMCQALAPYSSYGACNMAYGTQLKVVNTQTGMEEVASTEGYWHILFIRDTGTSYLPVGWMKNNRKSWGGDYSLQMTGRYTQHLGNGNKPDHVWLVHDTLGDGPGSYDSSTGIYGLGADDMFYYEEVPGGGFLTSNELLLFGANRVRGDVAQLPAYGVSSVCPELVLSTVPEPATLCLLSLGLVLLKKRK